MASGNDFIKAVNWEGEQALHGEDDYSLRSATIGSTCAALRAGSQQATIATASINEEPIGNISNFVNRRIERTILKNCFLPIFG